MYIGESEGRASRTKVMLISCSISEMCTKTYPTEDPIPDPPLMQIQHIMDLSPLRSLYPLSFHSANHQRSVTTCLKQTISCSTRFVKFYLAKGSILWKVRLFTSVRSWPLKNSIIFFTSIWTLHKMYFTWNVSGTQLLPGSWDSAYLLGLEFWDQGFV